MKRISIQQKGAVASPLQPDLLRLWVFLMLRVGLCARLSIRWEAHCSSSHSYFLMNRCKLIKYRWLQGLNDGTLKSWGQSHSHKLVSMDPPFVFYIY